MAIDRGGARTDHDIFTGSMMTTEGFAPTLEAIRNRRSSPLMQAVNPPKKLVQLVLEAAVCAPNHYRTSPWRFTVVSGSARLELGEAMAESLLDRLQDDEDEERVDAQTEALLEKERRKPLRAPVIIAVACVPSHLRKVTEIEEVCAVAAG